MILVTTRHITSFYVLLLVMCCGLLWPQASYAQAPGDAGNGKAEEEPSFTFDSPEAQWSNPGQGVHEYRELPPDAQTERKVKKPSFSGYTRQKEYFSKLCAALYEDDRAEAVAKVGEQYKGGVVGCPACKTFFRLIFSQCTKAPPYYREIEIQIANIERTAAMGKSGKGKRAATVKKKKAAKSKNSTPMAEEAPSREDTKEELLNKLPKKQLEPRLAVIDATLRLSQTLADDKARLDDHYQVIKMLEQDLRISAGRTRGEISYFDIFTTYLMAPFAEYEVVRKRLEILEKRKEDQRQREFMFDSNQGFGGSEDLEDLFGE